MLCCQLRNRLLGVIALIISASGTSGCKTIPPKGRDVIATSFTANNKSSVPLFVEASVSSGSASDECETSSRSEKFEIAPGTSKSGSVSMMCYSARSRLSITFAPSPKPENTPLRIWSKSLSTNADIVPSIRYKYKLSTGEMFEGTANAAAAFFPTTVSGDSFYRFLNTSEELKTPVRFFKSPTLYFTYQIEIGTTDSLEISEIYVESKILSSPITDQIDGDFAVFKNITPTVLNKNVNFSVDKSSLTLECDDSGCSAK